MSISSIISGLEVRSIFNLAAASSTKSIALSGRNRSEIYLSDKVDAATRALDSLQSTAASHRRAMILEVMGRDAGHIALNAGIAGGADVILIPEINYSINGVIKKLNEIAENNKHNPVIYKLLAEGYEKIQEKYNSRLALINFYNIKGNIPMAFRVIDDGLTSNELNEVQKKNLKSIRTAILCEGNPPLEPIFGNKTCD